MGVSYSPGVTLKIESSFSPSTIILDTYHQEPNHAAQTDTPSMCSDCPRRVGFGFVDLGGRLDSGLVRLCHGTTSGTTTVHCHAQRCAAPSVSSARP